MLRKERPDKLKLFEADLLEEGSFSRAAAGCDTVFHLASPFLPFKVRNPQSELIDPAVRGTANVLAAASATRSVGRVVLTSSVAAVMGDSVDQPVDEQEMFSEDDWNVTSSVAHQPYSYSKTLAEREAWRLAAEQEQWDMVVINPSFVLGPSLSQRSDSTSTGMVIEFLKGSYKSGVPALSFGIVDVRDVAEAHLRVAVRAGAEGRHIISGPVMSMYEVAGLIGQAFPGRFPLPSKQLPKFLLYLFGPSNGFTWKYISRNIGIPFALDAGKSRRTLDMSYRPAAETIRDQVNRLLECGLV